MDTNSSITSANGWTNKDMKLLVNTHYQKPGVCRVHYVWHSANNHFAECRKNKNTRQKKHSKILVLTCVISSVLVEPVFSKLHRIGWFLGHAQCCKFDIYFYCIINSMNIERKLNLQLHNREESHLFPTISSFYWFYPKPQKNMVDGGRPQVALRRGLHEKLERKSLVRRLLDLINKLHPVEGRRINDGDWFL